MDEGNFFKQDTLADEAAAQEETPIPKQIGPYVIESLLDRGGMSILYLGLHPETHEPLTIKVLPQHYLSHPDMVNRFLREAEIIGLTDHPNIVKLYGQGQWEGGLYIAMEFIHGLSLRQLILQNSLTVKRSLEIVLQIAYALLHLHSHGVIHRDLKPENILLTSSGGIKVIDFGIAQLHEEGQEESTTKKVRVIGTPVYMSPEQKADPMHVSYPADIYSLAIITYELVLGKLSYGIIHLALVPVGLQKILHRALQPNPNDRYPDIMDFITDLNKYITSDTFEKEIGKSDYTSELFEELKTAQTLFLPQAPPQWSKVDLGIANSHSLHLLPVYYDFFALENGMMAIILAEPSTKGASSLLYTSFFKGLVDSEKQLLGEPAQLVEQLNNLITEQAFDQFFIVSALVLIPNKHQLRFVSCGFGPLWYIPANSSKIRRIHTENIALGISSDTTFVEINNPWNVGDRLLLHTFQAASQENTLPTHPGMTEENFQQALLETAFLSPQKQVDALLRKISPQAQHFKEERPLSLISIHRKM